MDIENYFKNEINKLLIQNNIYCQVNLRIFLGYNRCMARVWDGVTWDINKRCSCPSVSNNLCKTHLKKSPSGYINQYPDEKIVLRAYRKHNHNVESFINITSHKSYYKYLLLNSCFNNNLNINLKDKKNINYNLKMSLESHELLDKLLESHSNNNSNKDDIRLKIIKDLKEKDNFHLTIAEDKFLKSKITQILETKSKTLENTKQEKDDLSINKSSKYDFNIADLEQLTIIDNDFNEFTCYIYFDHKSNNLLFTKNKKQIGFYREWIDDDDEVPDDFKTKDSKVLHPENQLPIIEVEITENGSKYSGLNSGIYREYEYDEDFEQFRQTNQIHKM
uniref:Uncharacterized protein n=1 Tax=viral metagenome TaxID=1070528 RepID=A0A6C0JBR3_9ZZZZ